MRFSLEAKRIKRAVQSTVVHARMCFARLF
jgi:hypothetical protein